MCFPCVCRHNFTCIGRREGKLSWQIWHLWYLWHLWKPRMEQVELTWTIKDRNCHTCQHPSPAHPVSGPSLVSPAENASNGGKTRGIVWRLKKRPQTHPPRPSYSFSHLPDHPSPQVKFGSSLGKAEPCFIHPATSSSVAMTTLTSPHAARCSYFKYCINGHKSWI